MKSKALIIPVLVALFLGGCNSTSSKKDKSSSATSSQPTSEFQPIPSYPDMPDYGDYEGEPGVAPNHIQSISINPNKDIYVRVGDVIPVNGSVSPGTIPTEEKVITYSVSSEQILSLTTSGDDATVKCLAAGTATLTAKSIQGRYTRNLVVHVLPDDGLYDIYETSLSIDKEKAKFGWVSTTTLPNGTRAGISQFGHQSWRWSRSSPAPVSSYGGAVSLGSGNNPEGAVSFTTWFSKPVKQVLLGIATSKLPDDQAPFYAAGSSKLTATMNETELSRVVAGTTYAPGEECYTLRATDEETVLEHKVLCDNLSGEFTFNLTESTGYIRIRYIVVEFDDATPKGNLTETDYSFDDEAFTETLTDAFAAKNVTDSEGLVNISLTKVKNGDESTSNHPMIDRNSSITITSKKTTDSIAKVELVTSQFIQEGQPVENNITVRESYLSTDYMRDYGVVRTETVRLGSLAYGCKIIEIKNTSAADIYLGIVSIKVTMTDACSLTEVEKIQMDGTPFVMEYSDGDSFNPQGASIDVYFTNHNLLPLQINNLMEWPELHENDTSTTGSSVFGNCTVSGFTTGAYVNKTWVKATAAGAGKYLVISADSKTMLDGSAATSTIQSGSSNRDITSYFDGDEIHGDYQLDHSNIMVIAASSGKFKIKNANDTHYFYGCTNASNGKISFSATNSKNFTFSIVDGELSVTLDQTISSVAYHFTFVLTTKGYFGFVDFDKNPELCAEHVYFYQMK